MAWSPTSEESPFEVGGGAESLVLVREGAKTAKGSIQFLRALRGFAYKEDRPVRGSVLERALRSAMDVERFVGISKNASRALVVAIGVIGIGALWGFSAFGHQYEWPGREAVYKRSSATRASSWKKDEGHLAPRPVRRGKISGNALRD
ncbi:MAG: hypothetical protein WDA16_01710 [Candidatus Thermoplasmatota archaeon]